MDANGFSRQLHINQIFLLHLFHQLILLPCHFCVCPSREIMIGVQQPNGGLSRTSLTCRVFSVSQHTGLCFTAGNFVPVPCKIFHRHFFLHAADSYFRQTALIKPLLDRRKEVAALFSGQKRKPQINAKAHFLFFDCLTPLSCHNISRVEFTIFLLFAIQIKHFALCFSHACKYSFTLSRLVFIGWSPTTPAPPVQC